VLKEAEHELKETRQNVADCEEYLSCYIQQQGEPPAPVPAA
jgi:hypothetical protein